MRAIARSLFLLSILSVAAMADPRAEITDLLVSMANALSNNDPAGFMAGVAKSYPDHDRLSDEIHALMRQGDISSSVQYLSDEGDDTHRTVQLDWYLEIHTAPAVARRKTLDCKLEKQHGKWRITALSPLTFFSAHEYQ